MIQAALGGLILLGIYKFMSSQSEIEIDWWMTAAFIFVPAIMILLLAALFGIFNISQAWLLLGYVLYFIIPFLILKIGFEFKTGSAIKFSSVVPVVAILTEVIFVLLLNVGA